MFYCLGYVNKLKANCGKINQYDLMKWFMSNCCSCYGSHLCNFNSSGVDKICKSWNVDKICKSWNVDITRLLHGLLLGQTHI